MTKKEAVENHRKMWRWIAEETLREKRKVYKYEYLLKLYGHQYEYDDICNECFCCEYASQFTNDECHICPVVWPTGFCGARDGLYAKFVDTKSLKQRAEIARVISELPERETTVFDVVEVDKK